MSVSIREEGITLLKKITKSVPTANAIDKQLHDYATEYIMVNSLDEEYYDNIYYCKLQEVQKAVLEGDLVNRMKKDKDLKENLVRMPACKLVPKVWEDLIYKQNLLKDKQDNLATSDIYECPACGVRKCIVTQAQIRSADEGMHTFFKCVPCGHTMTFE
jgi:DNA-directed RNA polymerase subunit M/transcription elongation factor TFIIS